MSDNIHDMIPPTNNDRKLSDVKAEFHTRLSIMDDQISVVSNVLMQSTLITNKLVSNSLEEIVDLLKDINSDKSMNDEEFEERIGSIIEMHDQSVNDIQELLQKYQNAYNELENMQRQIGQIMANKNFKMPKG